MKRRYVAAFMLAALAGVGLRWAYAVCPNPLFALVAPIRASAWEQIKRVFWPGLAAGWYFCRCGVQPGAVLAALLGMPAALLGARETLRCGFLLTGPVVDALLAAAVLAGGCGFVYAHRRSRCFSRAAGVLAMLVGMLGTCVLVFSVAAPDLPLFSP